MALFLEKSFSFPSQRNVYTNVWSDSKESACNAGDLGSIPGSGRSPGKGNGYPLKCSCLENSMDRGAHSRLQSMGLQKVGHNWATNTFTFFLFSLGNKIESVSRNIFKGPPYSSLSRLASAAAELEVTPPREWPCPRQLTQPAGSHTEEILSKYYCWGKSQCYPMRTMHNTCGDQEIIRSTISQWNQISPKGRTRMPHNTNKY